VSDSTVAIYDAVSRQLNGRASQQFHQSVRKADYSLVIRRKPRRAKLQTEELPFKNENHFKRKTVNSIAEAEGRTLINALTVHCVDNQTAAGQRRTDSDYSKADR
jgi:hypothetical protein